MGFSFDLDKVVRAERRRQWGEQRANIETTRIFQTPLGPRKRPQALGFKTGCVIAEFLLRSLGVYEVGHRRALDVRRTAIALTIPDLPKAFDGYQILFVSDLHIDAMDGLADAICRAVRGSSVDLCVINGDYRWGFAGNMGEIARDIARVVKEVRARDAVVAVLGNHDYAGDLAMLEASGIQGLVNETIVIERGSDRLMVTGVDDVHMFYTPAALAEIERPKTLGPGTFGIALVHSPEFATVASDNGYRLYLTGHTHGGQICLPGGMPLVTALLTHRKLARRGLWRNGGMSGFTSAGAGVSAIRVRYFSHGEVTVLTLRRAGE